MIYANGKDGDAAWLAYGHLSCESEKLQISMNICSEKLKNCGYKFKWSFEEALEDWFEDNDKKFLK